MPALDCAQEKMITCVVKSKTIITNLLNNSEKSNMWVEIFRTGKHVDAAGKEGSFNRGDLDKIVLAYNEGVSDDESRLAPVVKGHPKDNDPAYGWVEKLKRSGEVLLARLKDLTPEFTEELRNKMYRKISMSIYPDMNLRHVGFLGAVQPAVKGLKPVSFSEGDYSAFESDYKAEENDDDKNLKKRNEELVMKFNEQSEQLKAAGERIKELSHNAFVNEEKAFCENLVRQGKMLPKEADANIDMLVSLRELDDFFSFTEPASDDEEGIGPGLYRKHRDMLKAREVVVNLGSDHAAGFKKEDNFLFSQLDLNEPENRKLLHERAAEISEREHRDYMEALNELLAY